MNSAGSVNKGNIFDEAPAVDSAAKRPAPTSPPPAVQPTFGATVEGPPNKRSREAPEESIFEISQFKHHTRTKVNSAILRGFWAIICDIFFTTHPQHLPNVKATIDNYTEEMKNYGCNTSTLEDRIKNLFNQAAQIVVLRSACSNGQTLEAHAEAVKAAEGVVTEVVDRRCNKTKEVGDLRSKRAQQIIQCKELKKKLAEAQSALLVTEASLSQAEDSLSKLEEEETIRRADVQSVAETPCISEKELSTLRTMEAFFEESRRSLSEPDVTTL